MNSIQQYKAFILASLTVLIPAGCINIAGECETELSRRIFNPDNTLQVVTFITDCGATTSSSYGVRLIEGTDTTGEGLKENTVQGSNKNVGLQWISNDTLVISNADTTSGYTMKTQLTLPKSKKIIHIIYNNKDVIL